MKNNNKTPLNQKEVEELTSNFKVVNPQTEDLTRSQRSFLFTNENGEKNEVTVYYNSAVSYNDLTVPLIGKKLDNSNVIEEKIINDI